MSQISNIKLMMVPWAPARPGKFRKFLPHEPPRSVGSMRRIAESSRTSGHFPNGPDTESAV